MESKKIYRAKAPLRISFCGGGTDVSPYPEERGGVVLSSTIDKYAYASVRPVAEDRIHVHSLDLNVEADYPMGEKLATGEDPLDLVKGVVNHLQWGAGGEVFPSGCDIFLHTDAPPGSGLGSSSTLVTSLLGALASWLRLPLTPYEIAERTFQVERKDLALAGGRQDQYAATFGGFNFIEFFADHTVVNPLRLRRDTQNELEYSLLLCFTGRTRESAHIVEHQAQSYVQGNLSVIEALDEMKRITHEMKGLLLRDRIAEFGQVLHEAWTYKKNLDPGVTTDQIDTLYGVAREEGALGGKILGAGGGGFLMTLVPFEKKNRIAAALTAEGGEIQPFAFEDRGLQTWTAHA